MSLARRSIVTLAISLAVVAVAPRAAGATSLFDPIYRYRTFRTAHFSIHFHQGEEMIARRLAGIAEDVWQKLSTPLGVRSPSHTHVVLVDQTEFSNGFATPLPYDTIVITAVWPSGAEYIGKSDDWLRIAFSHEFTHIVHLDRSEGWAKYARRAFGRTPLAFPNLYLPQWQVEGLATYEESLLTGEGRLHAGDFGSIVEEAGRRHRLEPIDRVNGGLTDWPNGDGAYAYGADFHRYLAERFGQESLARLAEATARWIPFVAPLAFEDVYGRSLGALWREYQEEVTRRTASSESAAAAHDASRRLTRHGRAVAGPRFESTGCRGCPQRIIYSARTLDGFPALYEVSTSGGAPKRLAERYLGSTAALSDDMVYFDQSELRRNAGLYSDLYALERATGRVRRLTKNARLIDPDLSPDGRTLVAVRNAPDRRELVTIDLAARALPLVSVVLSESATQFNAPRWSPDGRTIAAERHVLGRQSDIVLVDRGSGALRIIAGKPDTRFVTPTWRPDGRAIVAAADLDEGPFNLYEIALDSSSTPPRQLTHTTGGATWPDVSRDGSELVFVGYTVDGFDVFVMPYPATASPDSRATAHVAEAADVEAGLSAHEEIAGSDFFAGSRRRPAAEIAQTLQSTNPDSPVAFPKYSPLKTLPPTAWSPIIEGDDQKLRLGFLTGGVDVLGYHEYSTSISWLARSPSGADAPTRGTPDWTLSYVYDRWRPTFWLSASADTSFFSGDADADGVASTDTLREHKVEGGVLFPVRHVRTSQRTLFSIVQTWDQQSHEGERFVQRRIAGRGGWSITSAREYAHSISPEDGGTIGVTAEIAQQVPGSSTDASTLTADGRVYWSPLGRHQVMAIRLAGGISTGDPDARRIFYLGGAQPNAITLDFGTNAISLLRGFGSYSFGGNRVALLNVEYRWPIARPQRGYKTWPFFIHTVHGAAFADVGNTWTRTFRLSDVKSSVGAELSANTIVAYGFPLRLSVGAAWGQDGSGAVARRGSVYLRAGRSF